MWTSSSILYISLFCHQQIHILFMYHALYYLTFISTIYVPCFFFILIDHNWKQVLLIKWIIVFLKLKNIFLIDINLLKMIIFTTLFWRWSTLWNSKLKITTLFRRRLTLLTSTFKYEVATSEKVKSTLNQQSTVNVNSEIYNYRITIVNFNVDTHTTLFQVWFDFFRCCNFISR